MAKTDATYPSRSNLLSHLYRLMTAIGFHYCGIIIDAHNGDVAVGS